MRAKVAAAGGLVIDEFQEVEAGKYEMALGRNVGIIKSPSEVLAACPSDPFPNV